MDSDRVKLSFVKETNFGVAVSGSPLQVLRFTGESLQQNTTIQTSNEINSTRMTKDVKRTGLNASGDINIELSYGSFDTLLQASLFSADWSAPVTVTAATISAAASDNSFNDSGAGFGSLVAGQWIKVSGFTTTANNGYFKIVSKTTAKIVVSGGTLVDEVAGDTVSVVLGGMIVNGTTLASFNIERSYTNLSQELALFTGMVPSTLNLSVQAGQLITGSMGFMGVRETSITASNGNGYSAASSTDIMSATDDVQSILEGGSSVDITSFSLALNNNLRNRLLVAELGPKSIGAGQLNLTGSLQMYFETKALMDKYLNQTASTLSMVLADPAGNAYVLDLPRVKYTNGKRVAGGINTDIIADMAWTAIQAAAEAVMVRLTRFPAA